MTTDMIIDPVAPKLMIAFEGIGRSGTTGTLTAKIGDVPVHVDQVNIAKVVDRQRFVADLARNHPGIDPDEVGPQLLNIAGQSASRAKGASSRRDPTAADRDVPYVIVHGRLCRTATTLF